MQGIETPTAASVAPRHRLLSRTHWPLTLLLAGFPLWWVLGLSSIMPVLIAIPLLWQLKQTKNLRVPIGFGWWILLLVWVCASVAMLWANAPQAVPGGGLSRLLVFGYRFGWYASCTVVLLWVINTGKDELSNSRVVRLLGWMFVVTVAGGLLGMLAPRFEITSLVEMLLPSSLSSNTFVSSIVHPTAASLTTFLGREEYRPVAPFAFANSWGSNLSMFLPFFLVGWFNSKAGWRRFAAPVILLLAVPPVVYSMNRGLWGSLGLGLVILVGYLLVRGPRRHRVRLLTGLVTALTVAAIAFSMSPLADSASERLDNAHSNDRRGQLLTQTVVSTATGSPVLGFGSTRDVQGSFASIAGGGTPDCPSCGVPPLGTQGHLWLVIFSQGLVGAAFFLVFFLRQAWHFRRIRTQLQLAAMTLLAFFALQLLIYDTLGMPMFTIMLALGLVWREEFDSGRTQPRHLVDFWPTERRTIVVVGTFMLVGALLGGSIALLRPALYSAQTSILLAPTPVHLSGALAPDAPQSVTVDTEAALIVTQRTLHAVQAIYPELSQEQIRSRVEISATPNTRVLHLKYTDTSPERVQRVTEILANEYLLARGEYLLQRRNQYLTEIQTYLMLAEGEAVLSSAESSTLEEEDEFTQLRNSIIDLTVSDTSAGELLTEAISKPARNQPEVLVASATLIGLLTGLIFDHYRRTRLRAYGGADKT